jgi:TM2 domain-containing membrane protein YozV
MSEKVSPGLAAVIDFIFPGVGLLYLGEFGKFVLRVFIWVLTFFGVMGLFFLVLAQSKVNTVNLNMIGFYVAVMVGCSALRFYEIYTVYQLALANNRKLSQSRRSRGRRGKSRSRERRRDRRRTSHSGDRFEQSGIQRGRKPKRRRSRFGDND